MFAEWTAHVPTSGGSGELGHLNAEGELHAVDLCVVVVGWSAPVLAVNGTLLDEVCRVVAPHANGHQTGMLAVLSWRAAARGRVGC